MWLENTETPEDQGKAGGKMSKRLLGNHLNDLIQKYKRAIDSYEKQPRDPAENLRRMRELHEAVYILLTAQSTVEVLNGFNAWSSVMRDEISQLETEEWFLSKPWLCPWGKEEQVRRVAELGEAWKEYDKDYYELYRKRMR